MSRCSLTYFCSREISINYYCIFLILQTAPLFLHCFPFSASSEKPNLLYLVLNLISFFSIICYFRFKFVLLANNFCTWSCVTACCWYRCCFKCTVAHFSSWGQGLLELFNFFFFLGRRNGSFAFFNKSTFFTWFPVEIWIVRSHQQSVSVTLCLNLFEITG